MPLHLLGKKSWNVYNTDNVARVRRDEAAAQAAEEAEEQRMQEVDAQRRLAILRGEEPQPIEEDEGQTSSLVIAEQDPSKSWSSQGGGPKKKRKKAGEDDTEFELRVAKEKGESQWGHLEAARKPTSSAPIMDRNGHIDLFGDEKARAHKEKNEEAEAEAKKKKREYEDQYTMRLSNAAGKDALANNPWYSKTERADTGPTKNVWGKDDPKRKEREANRMSANDPLAMMKKGASMVRQVRAERKKIQDERDEELGQLRKEQRHGDRRHRSHPRSSRRSDRSRERSKDRTEERRRHGDEPRRERHGDESRRERHRDRDTEKRRHRRSRSPEHRRHH